MKDGWNDTSNGCDGSFGGTTGHVCVLNPSKLFSKKIVTRG